MDNMEFTALGTFQIASCSFAALLRSSPDEREDHPLSECTRGLRTPRHHNTGLVLTSPGVIPLLKVNIYNYVYLEGQGDCIGICKTSTSRITGHLFPAPHPASRTWVTFSSPKP